MWAEIANGFWSNLTPMTLLIIALGTVFGAISGALPGVSAVTAMALTLPLSFNMEPAQALVLLGAVYMSSEFGQAIPAILFGTPGGSGAACTMLDGYPMTRKGQAEDALYLQLFAGTIGGAMGVLLLLFFTPALASMAQELGPPELFWAAVAGLTLVASLSARNIIGGLIAVCIGVLLTFPGQDPTTGQLRFTFGNPDMVGGLNEVPVMLGMFAIASILEMLELPDDSVARLDRRPGVIKYVLQRMWGMKKVLSWTSFVGAAVGLVPGAGASASSFAAYAEAKRLSKNPEEFGKGAWEGVAAPEAANNAVVGGSLVSLLGVGIPASATSAIMFGALTVHGIVAGPQLFETHSEVAYTFITGLLITVVAMLIFGLATVRYSAAICRIPVRFVVPGVLGLTLVGAFGLRNNPFDVVVAALVGVAAFLLNKAGISWIPMALGLVLGQVMEQRFQQSMVIGPTRGGLFEYWFTRPVSLALIVIVVLLLVAAFRSVLRESRVPAESLEEDAVWAERLGVLDIPEGDTFDPDGRSHTKPGGGSNVDLLTPTVSEEKRWLDLRTTNLLVAFGSIALGAWIWWQTTNWLPRAGQLPKVVAVILVILGALMLVLNLVPRFGAKRTRSHPFEGVPWIKWVLVVVGLLVVSFTMEYVGMLEALCVYMFAVVLILTDRSKPLRQTLLQAAACAVVVTIAMYLGFVVGLNVSLPTGLIF
jgi:putative tricarboxylic transport membrane protein